MIKKLLEKHRQIPVAVRATLWYTLCSIIQKSISLITVPLFTSLLTTEQYGEFSVYQSWFSILLIFTTLTLNGGVFNQAMIEFKKDRWGYISATQGLILVLNLIFLGLFLIIPKTWETMLGLPSIIILAMVFEMSFKLSTDFWGAKKRYEYKYRSYVIVTLIYSILGTLISLLFVYISKDRGTARILSFSIFSALFGLAFFLYNLSKGKTLFNWTYWKYALRFAIPLIPYYLSQMIFNQSDRIMIRNMLGDSAAGIYSLAVNLSMVLNFVLTAIESSYLPYLYQHLDGKQFKGIKRRVNQMVFVVLAGLVMVILFAPEVITIMAPASYSSGLYAMPSVISSLFFLFLVKLFVAILFYYKKKTALVMSSIICAIINIVLNYFWLPMFGFVAAGYTTLIAYILFALGTGYYAAKYCRQFLHFPLWKLYDLKTFVYMSIFVIVFTFLAAWFYQSFLIRVGLYILIIIACIIYRKKIIEIIKTVLGKGAQKNG